MDGRFCRGELPPCIFAVPTLRKPLLLAGLLAQFVVNAVPSLSNEAVLER